VVNNTTDATGVGASTFSTTSTGITTGTNGNGYAEPFDWHSVFGTAPTVP
jgi:hypothetical protein